MVLSVYVFVFEGIMFFLVSYLYVGSVLNNVIVCLKYVIVFFVGL